MDIDAGFTNPDNRKRITYLTMSMLKEISSKNLQYIHTDFTSVTNYFDAYGFVDNVANELYIYFSNEQDDPVNIALAPSSGLPGSCTSISSKNMSVIYGPTIYAGQGYNVITDLNSTYDGTPYSPENLEGLDLTQYAVVQDQTIPLTQLVLTVYPNTQGFFKLAFNVGCDLKLSPKNPAITGVSIYHDFQIPSWSLQILLILYYMILRFIICMVRHYILRVISLIKIK